jgi:hypothetical protein
MAKQTTIQKFTTTHMKLEKRELINILWNVRVSRDEVVDQLNLMTTKRDKLENWLSKEKCEHDTLQVVHGRLIENYDRCDEHRENLVTESVIRDDILEVAQQQVLAADTERDMLTTENLKLVGEREMLKNDIKSDYADLRQVIKERNASYNKCQRLQLALQAINIASTIENMGEPYE